MFRIRRRESVLLAAILTVSGCMFLGGTLDRGGTTRLRSAEIATASPILPAFVLRIAVADLALDPSQAALAKELARDSDRYARPIDEARAVFIEELIRAVEADQFSTNRLPPAADEVVRAAAAAAIELDAALAKLHTSLEPWLRRQLASRVRARFSDWSGEWKAGTADEHTWLRSIETDHLASSVDDTRATTRRWADGLLADVQAGEKLDKAGRRELIVRLRQAGTK